jgi:hypothetical protein
MKDDRAILLKYFPEAAVEQVLRELTEKKSLLHFSKSRRTKLGDYRTPLPGKPHRISLNHDLNPYEMLITFVHELAHLYTYEKYGRNHQPHGNEWKKCFGQLMHSYLDLHLFPEDVKKELIQYLYGSKAANGSDLSLRRVLKNYDTKASSQHVVLETLAENTCFKTADGRVFQKLEQRTKRFKCLCLNNKRYFLFSPLAVVEPIRCTN